MAEKSNRLNVQVSPTRLEPSEDSFAPLVDIYDTDDGTTVLLAEVPGASNESVDIRVDKGVLTISAEGVVPALGEKYARDYTGFSGRNYFRAFALSDGIDRDRIEASLENGTLVLRLPRGESAQTRKIEIKSP